jgi:hypothetical protein
MTRPEQSAGPALLGVAGPGPSATSAFLGARLGAALVLFNAPRIELGGWLVYENDLRRDTVPWPTSGTTVLTTARVGTERTGFVLGIGAVFDL